MFWKEAVMAGKSAKRVFAPHVPAIHVFLFVEI
jgi:hypothetical protein